MNIKILKACWLIIPFFMLSGCSFEKIGRNTAKGLMSSVSPAVDSIARNLINTIRTELTKEPSRQELAKFIDSLLAPAFLGIRNTIGSSRDSILNHQTLVWADSVLQTLTGERLNANLLALQASVVGKTKADIFEIERSVDQLVLKIVAGALSDSNRVKIGAFRDELLGPKTNSAIGLIIDSAVTHIVDSAVLRLSQRLRSDIDPFLRDDVSFIRKNAILLLSSLAALAAIIITLIWLNRRKYLRMVAMLAKQIHDIPNKEVYDEVTAKIKNEAVTAGLEPALRGVLIENGLISSDAWKKNTPGG
ncbi:MAG: hypothetical protein ABIQ31_00290 [Ferruginibacter sp.]